MENSKQTENTWQSFLTKATLVKIIGWVMIITGVLLWRYWFAEFESLIYSSDFSAFSGLMYYQKTGWQQFAFAFLLGGGFMTAICGQVLRK